MKELLPLFLAPMTSTLFSKDVSDQFRVPYEKGDILLKQYPGITYLNGVGSFLLRTRRGLLTLAGETLDAYE
jgi:hypothetical protein